VFGPVPETIFMVHLSESIFSWMNKRKLKPKTEVLFLMICSNIFFFCNEV